MTDRSVRKHNRNLLTSALLLAIATPMGATLAQDASAQQGAATELDAVVVTGSLIPQTELETSTPVTVISAEDIQMRGFESVADVLQQSSFTTGGLQGGQTSASFTQGAEAAGLFSLDPGYTKYLINGRPMANYPALYNGSDTFNNVSGIPVALVERIEILPGGQSSLYGSDAIAGVVNIILKKRLDNAEMTVRGGFFSEGGGDSLRFTIADSFTSADDRFTILGGLQVETRDPIWGYQRDLTRSVNANGYNDRVASRDFAVIDALVPGTYHFMDPNNCANTTSLFGGTTGLRDREGFGQYCGSFDAPGYRTLRNGKDSIQAYSYATFDLNDSTQLYGELMLNHEEIEYATGSSYTWWGTSAKYGAFYDPAIGSLVNLQRSFAPEDIGGEGYKDILNTDRNNAYSVAFGAQGVLGDSNWDYDIGVMRTEYELTERGWQRWAEPIDAYFRERVLGPQLGLDPIFGAYPVFRPDYANFYSPIAPEDFGAFSGYTTTESRTWNNMLRAQFTNASLFELPGGDAGFAVVAEAGNEGWDYEPDARMVADPDTGESQVWGSTSVRGGGHRSRYAVTSELRLPVLDPLTVTLSGRYDAFDVADRTIDKPTYSLGVEYRPVQSLLLRGKYGTAFRAPTLSDAFQGMSGYYSAGVDYYRCSLEGYLPGSTDDCGYNNEQFFGEQSGNPDLEPITADVWNAGFVWAPSANFSLSADYYSWKIENEVDQLSSDELLRTEYRCRTGATGPQVTSCDNALAWVTRGPNGELDSLYTPKVNVAEQSLEALTVSANYLLDIGNWGNLAFSSNYTNNLDHTLTPTPEQGEIDLLRDPYYMWVYDAYAKTRLDASVAWSRGDWTTTLYANRIGETPNYLAYALEGGYGDVEDDSGAPASKWGAYTTYNASVNYRATDDLTLSVMVNNLTNKMPDNQASNFPGTETTPYNNYFYNVFGRAVYMEARYQFGK